MRRQLEDIYVVELGAIVKRELFSIFNEVPRVSPGKSAVRPSCKCLVARALLVKCFF